MIKPWLKLLLFKSRIRNRHYDAAFGPHPEKYVELFKWFARATELEGDVLEFGVGSGGITCLMAEKLLETGKQKTIHSFDSFKGFNPEEFDESYARGDVTDLKEKNVWRTVERSLAFVRLKLKRFGFSHLVSLNPGFFQDTLKPFLNEQPASLFCFALVDCDLGSSVQFCAEAIYKYMTPGGVILIDDYRSLNPQKILTSYSLGVQRAVHEFVQEHPSEDHGYADGLYHFVK